MIHLQAFFYTSLFFMMCTYRQITNRWLGLKSLISSQINEAAAPKTHRLPLFESFLLKQIFLLRGITNKNNVFPGLASWLLGRIEHKIQSWQTKVEQVDVIDWNTDQELFYKHYFQKAIPVVIKNYNKHSDILSLDSLKSQYADVNTLITNLDSGMSEMGSINKILSTPDTRYYIHNSEAYWRQDSQLLDSLNLKGFEDFLSRKVQASQLFIGLNSNSGTNFHFENHLSIFYQIDGQKKWYLVDPEYSLLMYPIMAVKNNSYILSTVPFDFEQQDSKTIDQNYPLFKYCPRYEIDLEPGNILFSPPNWWHATVTESKDNLSVSNRLGSIALASFGFNDENSIDLPNTSHLMSTIQYCTPRLWVDVYKDIVHKIELGGQENKGETFLVDGEVTVFEKSSHRNQGHVEISSGKAHSYFGR